MAIQKKMLIGNLLGILTISSMLAVTPVAAKSGDLRVRPVVHVRSLPEEPPPTAEPEPEPEPESEPTWTAPAAGQVSSVFGSRWGSMHYGVDIANAIGTPISAAASGTVIDSGPASGYGLWVRVRHPDDIVTVYGHINESFVAVGQRVERGQRIATIGNRGQSTGPHLHFQIEVAGQPVDPMDFYETHSESLVG